MGTFTITQSNPNRERLYIRPNANGYGDCTNWTPTAGTNYQCVDEAELDVSDYIYTDSTTYLNELFDTDDPDDSYTGDIDYVKLYAIVKSEQSPQTDVKFYLNIAPNESCSTYYLSNEKSLTNNLIIINYFIDFNNLFLININYIS